jgi:outer membrane protein OmpA-like peptidoglycan-associated protein
MEALIIPAIALIAYLLMPATPAPDRIVLLPDAQGSVGKVLVKSAGGEQLLEASYASAQVGEGGQIALVTETEAAVKARYAATLSAQAPRAQSFIVYFQPGSSSELTPASAQVISELQGFLASRPVAELTVIGHTDRVGKVEGNDALSLKRAESVRGLLRKAGIQVLAMDVAGRGEREPLVPTEDEVAEAKNRRVEINVR